MGIELGAQTVTVISYAPTGTTDSLGVAVLTPTRTDVHGCRHRPLKTESARGAGMARSQEAIAAGVAIATEWWETTAPPHPAILAAKPSDRLEVDAQTYKIIAGVKPFKDLSGLLVKVSVLSEQQNVGY